MKIHHLNCGSMCPTGGFLFDGFSKSLNRSKLSCHCLLIETKAHGLVLVDTGLGTADVLTKHKRITPFFQALCRPQLIFEQTAIAQVRQLGYSPDDVRNIVLTHLDFDHAGGIEDFPKAKVHLLADEKRAAQERKGWIAQGRYRPEQIDEVKNWQTYEVDAGEKWFGFDAVRDLEGLPPEILMVPLIGHTLGHSGVAIMTDQGWLLHAGDAYFFRHEMDPAHPSCTPGLRFYQTLMETDRAWRVRNQKRLRELVRQHGRNVKLFCAHDFKEFELLQRARERDFEPLARVG